MMQLIETIVIIIALLYAPSMIASVFGIRLPAVLPVVLSTGLAIIRHTTPVLGVVWYGVKRGVCYGWEPQEHERPEILRMILPASAQPEEVINLAPKPITLDQVARSRNLLIVGSPGSGKTTLLRVLLNRRTHAVHVFDPHAAPNDWPNVGEVIGAGRGFDVIFEAMQAAERMLHERAQRHAEGDDNFSALTIAGDEWGSICSEVKTKKDEDGPGALLIRLLKEGRKFGINAIISAHGDTTASLGSKGDAEAFRMSFDWIIYCGGHVGQHVGEAVKSFPTGKTPEGNSFPLIVAVVNPATKEVRTLDMRGLMNDKSPPAFRGIVVPLVPTCLNVQAADEPFSGCSGHQEAIQPRSTVQSGGQNGSKSASSTAELPDNERGPTMQEARLLVKAVALYTETGSKQKAIEAAFGCKKGGGEVWKRASELFDAITR